jgi:hypothetical protein
MVPVSQKSSMTEEYHQQQRCLFQIEGYKNKGQNSLGLSSSEAVFIDKKPSMVEHQND